MKTLCQVEFEFEWTLQVSLTLCSAHIAMADTELRKNFISLPNPTYLYIIFCATSRYSLFWVILRNIRFIFQISYALFFYLVLYDIETCWRWIEPLTLLVIKTHARELNCTGDLLTYLINSVYPSFRPYE